MLTEDEVKNQYDEIMNQEISETEKALRLFSIHFEKSNILGWQ